MRRPEKVHGLYVATPLRDYHFAYLLKALSLLEDHYRARGMKGPLSYTRHLRQHLRVHFRLLVQETKRKRQNLDHLALEMLVFPEKVPEEFLTVYLDPTYPQEAPP